MTLYYDQLLYFSITKFVQAALTINLRMPRSEYHHLRDVFNDNFKRGEPLPLSSWDDEWRTKYPTQEFHGNLKTFDLKNVFVLVFHTYTYVITITFIEKDVFLLMLLSSSLFLVTHHRICPRICRNFSMRNRNQTLSLIRSSNTQHNHFLFLFFCNKYL